MFTLAKEIHVVYNFRYCSVNREHKLMFFLDFTDSLSNLIFQFQSIIRAEIKEFQPVTFGDKLQRCSSLPISPLRGLKPSVLLWLDKQRAGAGCNNMNNKTAS